MNGKCALCGIAISRGMVDYGCAQEIMNHAPENVCALESCKICAARRAVVEAGGGR